MEIIDTEESAIQFEDKLIRLNRVAKAGKGGRRFSFSALMVVGDHHGNVGYGQGKANDVAEAIRKGTNYAKKNVRNVVVLKKTIPYQVMGKFKSAQVLLKPAAPGTGIVAGSVVRLVLELCGIHDILSKSIGSRNPINIVKAVFNGFDQLLSTKEIAASREKKIEELWT